MEYTDKFTTGKKARKAALVFKETKFNPIPLIQRTEEVHLL